MALLRAESRQMYSWWWDSHISPKNSKWLQGNLTDMDVKIKSMIELIEEDADSFARKAEMYYKKRPELMKLVEEFYRAYRALAERYDHATRVIQHSHSTASELFPDQVPLMFADDSPRSAQTDPRCLEMPNLNGDFTDELDSVTRRKFVKLFDDPFGRVERVRKGLNFDEEEDKHGMYGNKYDITTTKDQKLSISDQEAQEIHALKEDLAKLETEEEIGTVQRQQFLDTLSDIENEMSKMKDDFRGLGDHSRKAENEAAVLTEAITRLYVDKESRIQVYKVGADSFWEHNQTTNDEVKANFNTILEKSSVEQNAAPSKYKQLQETISILQNKLQLTEESANRLKERAEVTYNEVETLREIILKLTEEKEDATTKYQHCLMTLSRPERELTCSQNVVKDLTVEINNVVSKTKSAEEKCLLLETLNQSLRSEVDSLMSKVVNQTQEFTKKQIELGIVNGELEERCMTLEEEKESSLGKLEELQTLLEVEKREHTSYVQTCEIQFSDMETEMKFLQNECEGKNRDLDRVLENDIGSEIQVLVLWITAQEMKERNCFLSVENQKLIEEYVLSANKVSQLEQKIFEQQVEIKSLLDQNTSLKAGTRQLMKALNVDDPAHADEAEKYPACIGLLLNEIMNMKRSLFEAVEENIERTVESAVLASWVRLLRLDLRDLALEKTNINQELKIKTEEVLALHYENLKLFRMNEELRSKLETEDCNEETLATEIENLCLKDCLHELHDMLNKKTIHVELLQFKLQKKQDEIDEMETEATSVSSQFHYSAVCQLLLEQKVLELHQACISYRNQNEHLKAQLVACSPEILSMMECTSSLESHTAVQIKFQNPENGKLQGGQVTNSPHEDIVNHDKGPCLPSTVSDLCNLRIRLQGIVKVAIEIKDQLVKENVDLRSKLGTSMRQLELLQAESARNKRSTAPAAEIRGGDGALLTKDIMLDQISDSSSHRIKRADQVDLDNQSIELWETGNSDGNIALTFSKKIVSPSSGDNIDHHIKSMAKQTVIQEEPSVDKLEISNRFCVNPVEEGNKKAFLQRLNSDFRHLASLQVTVHDLKKKLKETSKTKKCKGVIECDALKEQLEEAGGDVEKLIDLNNRLITNFNDRSFSSTNSSFDEDGSDSWRKMSQQAQNMAENIGRLGVEVQKLQFSLEKLDNDKEGKSRTQDTRKRAILKDYLYGGGRNSRNIHNKSPFCGCMQFSVDKL